jgi:prepilin-type N-terminal cleavage/methylation domain-containing protein
VRRQLSRKGLEMGVLSRFGNKINSLVWQKVVPQSVTHNSQIEVKNMSKSNESGFSLIELLLVVAIIGIVAALAVPALQKGIRAAENGTTFATMRTISSTQVGFFSQNNRFGRLTELQNTLSNGLGTTTGERVVRGRYVFEMNPVTPTDAELSREFTITATRSVSDDIIYKYELTHTGEIVQILP